MPSQVRAWTLVTLATSGVLAVLGLRLKSSETLPFYDRPAVGILLGTAAALFGCVLLLHAGRRTGLGERLQAAVGPLPDRVLSRPYVTMALISFAALFVELMLIRYASSQIRVFSFYKNVPLIGCFLGLGLGCSRAGGRPREVLLFLLWLIPLAGFLSAGSLGLAGVLGKVAAVGTTEHVLGDYLPQDEGASARLGAQMAMALFSAATLAVITGLFTLLGRLLGSAFESVDRLRGYTVNILGSLGGILAFILVSYGQLPPWLWFVVGLPPLLWWLPDAATRTAAVVMIALAACAVAPSYGDTVWSPYQKLVGHEVPVGDGSATGYLVEISDVFYQVAVDRSDDPDSGGHYDAIYQRIPRPETVLVVGAGTGNDVAAALRAGASRVEAVDIDPAIVAMGRAHHPEKPYDDPRVEVVVDDARHAFRVLPRDSYDVVVFGLLDSHTQLGMSSVRLDNYVFTLESFGEAARLTRPGGHVVVTAAISLDWFRERFQRMLESAVGGDVQTFRHGDWISYVAPVGGADPVDPPAALDLPTDDWPFLYLPVRGIPTAYLWVVAFLVVTSVALLRVGGLRFAGFGVHYGHLFFLGAAFLLMEVHAINRLALLFGTTWIVSAVAIALVLLLIVGANLVVLGIGRVPYAVGYLALGASLALSYAIDPDAVLGRGPGIQLAFGLLLLSPVFFAGLIFARSFAASRDPAPAMGANIMGAVLGGWSEYATMALGVRSLLLVAASFYLVSLLLVLRGDEARASDP